jgi:hypothetical protein
MAKTQEEKNRMSIIPFMEFRNILCISKRHISHVRSGPTESSDNGIEMFL